MSRQKLLLGTLLGILSLALGYAYWGSPRQERVVPVVRTPAQAKGVEVMPVAERTSDRRRVRLDILERGVEAFSEPKRDIFRLARPRPVLPPPPPPPVITQAPPVAAPPPVLAPSPPPIPLPRFTVLGLLQKEGGRSIFLSLNSAIFVVKEGTRFGDRQEFVVEKLTDQQLVIRQEGLPVPVTVSLSDLTSSSISASFKRPVTTGRSIAFGAPAFRRSNPKDAPADEVAEDAVPEPDVVDPTEEQVTENASPAEAPDAEKSDGNMSSLQLRSIFQ